MMKNSMHTRDTRMLVLAVTDVCSAIFCVLASRHTTELSVLTFSFSLWIHFFSWCLNKNKTDQKRFLVAIMNHFFHWWTAFENVYTRKKTDFDPWSTSRSLTHIEINFLCFYFYARRKTVNGSQNTQLNKSRDCRYSLHDNKKR